MSGRERRGRRAAGRTAGSAPRRGRVRAVLGERALDVLAAGGLVCILLVVAALVLDVTLIMFRTGSMAPTIPAGSVAVVRQVPAADIRVGDVVTVDRDPQLPVTHRVLTVDGTGAQRTITMQGDANASPDPAPYTVTTVRRVLWSLPGGARVIGWFGSPLLLGSIAVAASTLVTWAFWPRHRPVTTDG